MPTDVPNPSSSEPLLRAVELHKLYGHRSLLGNRNHTVTALDGVSFTLAHGSSTAVVGQSGSGKSTLAACLTRLEVLDRGELWFEDVSFTQLAGQRLRTARTRIQLIFQDATAALNPRLTAIELVEEPLLIQSIGSSQERRERATNILQMLGIPGDRHDSRPEAFSGGQRKRIALARALVLDPQLLILDEVFSGLDLLVAAEILEQLLQLRAERKLALLFISHDLNFLARAVDWVMVMQHGKIIEQGRLPRLFSNAQQPHTRSLVAAHRELQNRKTRGAAL